jgi:1-acyl-sn-glycerol-3-phosphate acyltransferase
MKEPKFYRFARLIVTAFVKLVYRPTVVGKENIPKEGGIVLAGNHTNYFDSILLISCTKRTIHFLGKKRIV